MKSLKEAAEEYIYLRRALGFKLRDAESLLKDFTDFMERENAPCITINLTLPWAKEPKNDPSLLGLLFKRNSPLCSVSEGDGLTE